MALQDSLSDELLKILNISTTTYVFQDKNLHYSILTANLFPLFEKYGPNVIFNTIVSKLEFDDGYQIFERKSGFDGFLDRRLTELKRVKLSNAFMDGIWVYENLEFKLDQFDI